MAFKPVKRVPEMKTYPMSNVAIVKGNAVVWSSGYITNATADSSGNIVGVAACSIDNSGGSAGAYNIAIWPAYEDVEFEVDTEGTPTQSLVGTVCDLSDANTIDEDSTGNSPVFLIRSITAAAGGPVIGSFIESAFGGVNN